MLTSKEYLQQAEECLQLANASSDVYVKDALTELASDFKAMAKDLEQRNADEKTDRRSPVHLVTGDDQIKQKTEEGVRHGLESIRRKLETIQGARQRRSGVGSPTTTSMSSMGGATSSRARFRSATASPRTRPERMSTPGSRQCREHAGRLAVGRDLD
jgi:hypothetical protein